MNGQTTGMGVFSPIARELTCYRLGASTRAPGTLFPLRAPGKVCHHARNAL